MLFLTSAFTKGCVTIPVGFLQALVSKLLDINPISTAALSEIEQGLCLLKNGQNMLLLSFGFDVCKNFEVLTLENFKLLGVLADNIQLLKDCCFLLAITLNILVLIYFKKPHPDLNCTEDDSREEC